MTTPLTVTAIDHIVLTVTSIPRSIAFYSQTLGMQAVEFKLGRFALHFGTQKINLLEVGNVVDPNVKHATPGSADICLRTLLPLEQAIAWLQAQGVTIVQGPVKATGAQATLRSVYFYDPDENLIEVCNEVENFK